MAPKQTKQTFETVLNKHEKLDATGIDIPFDVEEVFGAKRLPVKAVINGAEYRGSIVRMGGKYMLGIPKAFREKAGIVAGDHIVVTIERDADERTVTVPDDLAAALAEHGLRDRFDGMSYSHRKEHVRTIEEAKAAETRSRRIKKAIEMLQKSAR
jgi:bifunctional DNA-binding transcriptional regulator/antitoxin component of YhaV-PrlF toxin-antitoxin module